MLLTGLKCYSLPISYFSVFYIYKSIVSYECDYILFTVVVVVIEKHN